MVTPYVDPPAARPRLEDCDFYTSMVVPGLGEVQGSWDLRVPGPDAYLGHVELAGRRVLEVGPASGFLTAHMESRGAEVVSVELGDQDAWDLVPHAGADLAREQAARTAHLARLRNGFWYVHHAHGLRSRVVHSTAYAVPLEVGPVDVATFCAVLLHLRDPFLALQRGLSLCRSTAVVTDYGARRDVLPRLAAWATGVPVAQFLPTPEDPDQLTAWWRLTPALVSRFLAVLGFETRRSTSARYAFCGRPTTMFTIVAERVRPFVSPSA